jgi:N6-adenosine-specific RNA methylase IME4
MAVAKRELGRTGLQVTTLGYGTVELRGAPRARNITEQQAETAARIAEAAAEGYSRTDYCAASEHSRKPAEARARIEQYADGPYLEMFAREAAPGWTIWGNQIDKFAQIRMTDGSPKTRQQHYWTLEKNG